MGRHFLFLCGFLFALAGLCPAAEPEKNKQIDTLTSIQLGDYSLKFEGENPRKPNDLDDPPALKSFRKDVFNPFFGLKFSTPLKEDPFKSGR
jgi:hypothetical protein